MFKTKYWLREANFLVFLCFSRSGSWFQFPSTQLVVTQIRPWPAGITLASTSTRRPPHCFNLMRQIDVLERAKTSETAENVFQLLYAVQESLSKSEFDETSF